MNDLAQRVTETAERQASGEVVGPQTRTLADTIRGMEAQFRAALPKHVDVDRFVRLALTTLRTVPRLTECSTPSVLAGFMQAAQLGVEIDQVRGQAYLVPRRSKERGWEATFQLGYKGMIDLAGRGGITIEAREICENDEYGFRYGLDPELWHRPAMSDRGEAIAFYAVARFKDGRLPQFLVRNRDEIATVRDRFSSSKRDGKAFGPWADHFDAMARKTVIRQLLGYMPLPVELADAIVIDDENAADIIDAMLEPMPELSTPETPEATPTKPAARKRTTTTESEPTNGE